jgi:drug/metabolite transporter (DMT)-like permease
MRSVARSDRERGILIGFAAALSFGIAAPFAKLLLVDAPPQLLAGLLYLGATLLLLAARPLRGPTREARLRRADTPRLLALALTGGVVAPVLLLVGLERVSGSTGSLLLNLEGPFTLVLGVFIFGEYLGRRAALGAALVFGAAALLSAAGPLGAADPLGAACIGAACLLWGIDNNLTQSLTLRDPFSIVLVKVSVAAAVNVSLAFALGAAIPDLVIVLGALGLGAVSYGASILLDAYALRILGAARESVVFATAPFVGAIVAIPLLAETPSVADAIAAVTMIGGIALMLNERHAHHHVHDSLTHEHLHVHDAHHRHSHEPGVLSEEPHSHVHQHVEHAHSHPHVSDLHHRHRH